MNKDTEVNREPLDPEAGIQEVEDAFVFNNQPPSTAQRTMCEHVETYARRLAFEIATVVPEGKHRTVAINNVLGAVLWARQGILTAREIEIKACCDGGCDCHPPK